MQIANESDSACAGKRIRELLDRHEPAEAIMFAESCEGPEQVTDQLRALAYTHAGAMLKDRERLGSAAGLWRKAGAETHNAVGYNLANTELDLWQLAISERGFVAALQDSAHARSWVRHGARQ